MTPAAVLDFWFADGPDCWRPAWFRRDDAFDAAIRDRLGALIEPALTGGLDGWATSAGGALALILLLDQCPRNLFRGHAAAFSGDAAAQRVARELLGRGGDLRLAPVQRVFTYLPFEHSEAVADQAISVAMFEALPARPDLTAAIDYAHRHHAVIARFGRFPHRNAALGRPSTAEEVAYLAQPGAGF